MDARRRRALLVVASLVLAGCAGYRLEPLAVSHPAHPEAPAAPERPPSLTLAYAQSDIPSVQPASRPTVGGLSQTVVGEGHVVAAVPNSNQLVVDHEEIQGFMEAMTMGYRIDPPSLLAGLKPGDKIRFTIDLQRRAIIGIERLGAP